MIAAPGAAVGQGRRGPHHDDRDPAAAHPARPGGRTARRQGRCPRPGGRWFARWHRDRADQDLARRRRPALPAPTRTPSASPSAPRTRSRRTSSARRWRATSRPRWSPAATSRDNARPARAVRHAARGLRPDPCTPGTPSRPASSSSTCRTGRCRPASGRTRCARSSCCPLGLVVLWLGLFRTVATASRRLRDEAAGPSTRHPRRPDRAAPTAACSTRELAAAVDRSGTRPRLGAARTSTGSARSTTPSGTTAVTSWSARWPRGWSRARGRSEPGGSARRRRVRRAAARTSTASSRRWCTPRCSAGALRAGADGRARRRPRRAQRRVRAPRADAEDGPTMLRHADVAAEAAKRGARRRPAPTTGRRTSTARSGWAARPTWRGRSTAASWCCTTSRSATWTGTVLGVEALVRWQHPVARACCRRWSSSRSPSAPA